MHYDCDECDAETIIFPMVLICYIFQLSQMLNNLYDFQTQLDPPDSQQLFLRNAGVSFLFPPAWTLLYAQHGRYQRILCHIHTQSLCRTMYNTCIQAVV